ncbi:MAG: thioredoxin-like domain-containing protein [Flavobacteriales bacterium]
MKYMNLIACITIGATVLHGCDNANSSANNNSETMLAAATDTLVSGITAANSGMKTGAVELKGQLLSAKISKIYLWETRGKNTNKIDSAQITNATFTFGVKEYEQGIYMLGLNDKNMCSVIINPAESVCEVGFKSGMLEQSFYAINSKENEGWAKYMTQEPVLLKAIKDARVAGHKSPNMKVQYEELAKQKEAELLKVQTDLIAQYPNTHLAKILTWKQEPTKTEINKYWDNIDFTDESVIRSKVLSDRIESFMRTFSKGEESGFINCIATVAEKAKVNDHVLEFALNQMLVGFYESGMENICTFLIDNYVNGEACGDADLSNVIKNTAESIANLGIGKTPPNFTMDGTTGTIDLYKTAAANSYTLVMFWSSWCEHCKGEAPEVKACYDKWNAKGFEIIGVSIDVNKTLWQNTLKEREFKFPNVCGMKEYLSPVAKDFRVTKTPTFFLLDKDKKIVLKPKGIKEVQTYLTNNLK